MIDILISHFDELLFMVDNFGMFPNISVRWCMGVNSDILDGAYA
jgi:hypothetical protein